MPHLTHVPALEVPLPNQPGPLASSRVSPMIRLQGAMGSVRSGESPSPHHRGPERVLVKSPKAHGYAQVASLPDYRPGCACLRPVPTLRGTAGHSNLQHNPTKGTREQLRPSPIPQIPTFKSPRVSLGQGSLICDGPSASPEARRPRQTPKYVDGVKLQWHFLPLQALGTRREWGLAR